MRLRSNLITGYQPNKKSRRQKFLDKSWPPLSRNEQTGKSNSPGVVVMADLSSPPHEYIDQQLNGEKDATTEREYSKEEVEVSCAVNHDDSFHEPPPVHNIEASFSECNLFSDEGKSKSTRLTSQPDVSKQNDSSLIDFGMERASDTPLDASLCNVSVTNYQVHRSDIVSETEVPSKEDKLFKKTSIFWNFLDSLESSKFQPPHFQPLQEIPELEREGMAVTLMIIFSTVLEKLKNLRISDSVDVLKMHLATLVHLEAHGFDVQNMLAVTRELLLLKDTQDQLSSKRKANEELVLERQNEFKKLKAEADAIEKTILDLEQSIALSGEKKALFLQQKECVVLEIRTLRSSAMESEERIKMLEKVFVGAIDTMCSGHGDADEDLDCSNCKEFV